MSEMLILFCLAALIAAVLANIGIWSPRALWTKVGAVAAMIAFLPIGYVSFAELLSRPKPIDIEFINRNVENAIVVGSHIVEDKAIYVWLILENMDEPRAYALPWNQTLARQLHEANREAEIEGGATLAHLPFEPNLDRTEPMFYPEPQERLPEKATAPNSELQIVTRTDEQIIPDH